MGNMGIVTGFSWTNPKIAFVRTQEVVSHIGYNTEVSVDALIVIDHDPDLLKEPDPTPQPRYCTIGTTGEKVKVCCETCRYGYKGVSLINGCEHCKDFDKWVIITSTKENEMPSPMKTRCVTDAEKATMKDFFLKKNGKVSQQDAKDFYLDAFRHTKGINFFQVTGYFSYLQRKVDRGEMTLNTTTPTDPQTSNPAVYKSQGYTHTVEFDYLGRVYVTRACDHCNIKAKKCLTVRLSDVFKEISEEDYEFGGDDDDNV